MAKSKHYYVRNNIIYVCGSGNFLKKRGGNPPHVNKYYRVSTELEANEKNISYIEKHAVEVLYHLVCQKTMKSENFESFSYSALSQTAANRNTKTQKEALSLLRRFILPYFANTNLGDITHADVRYWQSALLEKGISKERTKRAANVFRTIMTEALFEDQINKNPFDKIKIVTPPKPKPKEPYTTEEIEKIITTANGWFKAYFIISIMTGFRQGEVRVLKWCDIDFENKQIKVYQSKTEKYKTVPMIHLVEETLLELKSRSKSKWLFPSSSGQPFTDGKNINKNHFKPLLKMLGIKYKSLQVTRHMFASILISNGMDVNWVSRAMGHAKIETTLKHYNIYLGTQNYTKKAQQANNIIKQEINFQKTDKEK